MKRIFVNLIALLTQGYSRISVLKNILETGEIRCNGGYLVFDPTSSPRPTNHQFPVDHHWPVLPNRFVPSLLSPAPLPQATWNNNSTIQAQLFNRLQSSFLGPFFHSDISRWHLSQASDWWSGFQILVLNKNHRLQQRATPKRLVLVEAKSFALENEQGDQL